MKKLFTLIAATILCVGAQAQSVNIHLKNGTSLYYSGNEVEYVDFDENMDMDVNGKVVQVSKRIGNRTWLTTNIGAANPWEPGNYYRWGERKGYTLDDIDPVTKGDKAITFTIDDYSKPTSFAEPSDMPSGFHTPTPDDFADLIANTIQRWGTYDDPNLRTDKQYALSSMTGLWFISNTEKPDSIFFPAVGYLADGDPYENGRFGEYWANGPKVDNVQVPNAPEGVKDNYDAMGLFFGSDADSNNNGSHWRFYQAEKRWYGLPIRPCKK